MQGNEAAAVVGAGFSGLSTARFLAYRGCPTSLFEEHGRVGFPKHCTGIISQDTLEAIGEPASRCYLQRYDAILVEGSRGNSFSVEKKGIAHILDRVCLEEELLREALSQGVNYKPHTRVESVEDRGDHVRLSYRGKTGSGQQEYSYAVLATGSRSPAIHPLLAQKRPPSIPGVNLVVQGEHGQDPQTIRVIFDHSLAPGFFAWLVPLSPDTMIAGLASSTPGELRRGLRRLLEEKLPPSVSLMEAYGGPVNRGPPLKMLGAGRVLLTGDAGVLVKPVTGGGLYPVAHITNPKGEEKGKGCSGAFDLLSKRTLRMASRLRLHYRVARLLHEPRNQGLIDRAIEEAAKARLGEVIGQKMGFDDHHLLARTVMARPLLALKLVIIAGPRALSLLVG